jgi:polyhydroxyalkanoate synthesis regulator phasin
MAAQKTATKLKAQAKSIVDRFEGTIVERPIIIANKAFLAGLGLASQAQSDFDKKFDALAKDGAKVRDQAQDSFEDLNDRVIKRVKATRKEVTKRAETAVNTVLEYSPIATTSDLKKLDRKLDKVLAQVAK